jgi:hypothetical protein
MNETNVSRCDDAAHLACPLGRLLLQSTGPTAPLNLISRAPILQRVWPPQWNLITTSHPM